MALCGVGYVRRSLFTSVSHIQQRSCLKQCEISRNLKMVPSPNLTQAYDTIVIGLGSAGVTAATTLVKGGKRVLGLEAQDRIGGRIHTVSFGNGLIELGGEWIHGSYKNCVYDLASKHNIALVTQNFLMDMFSSDGSGADSQLINELFEVCFDAMDKADAEPQPLGTFVSKKLKEHLANNKPDLLKDDDFIANFLEFVNSALNNYNASNELDDVTTSTTYEALDGPHMISWHKHGYKTFFDIMLNTHNNGPGLPNLDIKLNTEVTLITKPQHPGEKALVSCKDGSTYAANSVIVTVSLGVLKAKHSTLFSPPLPKDKQTAIEKISIGVMDKIILSFDEPWWPCEADLLGFLWKGDDRKKVAKEDQWITKIYGVSRPMSSSNSLTLFTNGDVAKEVETLPEDVVKTKCVELLQRFIGDQLKITVPQPTAILRSFWYSNPFTRGSYTYDNLLTPQYPDARAWLGAPLTDSAGAPRVLFAGEATSLRHFSTVHGASDTGYREAMRLLPDDRR